MLCIKGDLLSYFIECPSDDNIQKERLNMKDKQKQKESRWHSFSVQRLVMRFSYMFDCYDSVRISHGSNKYFLIIGVTRNTKDNPSYQTLRNGEQWDYDYVDEKCIASGQTEDEVIKSAIEYKRLCNMTMGEYIKELVA